MMKVLTAGLIVAAILAAPARADESCAAERRAAQNGYADVPTAARCFDGRLWIPAPPVRALTEAPTDQPGGVCDHGDNPQIC